MTEDEAKTKLCPMSFSTRCGRDGYGRSTSYTCIASACMAWRVSRQVGIGPNGERRDRDMDGRTHWVDDGYCGLAGVPK